MIAATIPNVRKLLNEESQLQALVTELGGMVIGLERINGSAAAQKELRLLRVDFDHQLKVARGQLDEISQQCNGHDMQHTYGREYQCTKCGYRYLA